MRIDTIPTKSLMAVAEGVKKRKFEISTFHILLWWLYFNEHKTHQKMRNSIITTISLCLLTGAGFAGPLMPKAPPALPFVPPSPSGGWYWGASGGYLWLNDAISCGCENLNYDSGWGINGVAGYHFTNGFSLGLSTGYLDGQYDVVDGDGGDVSGSADLQMVPVMLNATYSLDLTDSLLLYVGGGLGTALTELDGVDSGDNSSDWHFAWQGRAGFGYKISTDVTLNLGYRYIRVEDAMSDFGDAKGHMAEAGFKVKF